MRKTVLAAAFALVGGLAANPAHATLTLSPGLVGGSGDVDNVIFAACGLSGQSALTVQGCLNSSHTTLVNFTGTESLDTTEGGGQSRITSTDGNGFDYVKITMADPALGFGKLQFNLDAFEDGTATFRAIDQFGNVFNFGSFDIDGNGQNFFTLDSIDDQVAVSFELLSTVAIQDIDELQQVRLGPTEITSQVPEPGTLAAFGAALIGFGLLRRKRRA